MHADLGPVAEADVDGIIERFKRDLISEEIKKRVDADAKEASNIGLTGTPGFFINGRYLSGAKPFEDFKKLIDEELAKN